MSLPVKRLILLAPTLAFDTNFRPEPDGFGFLARGDFEATVTFEGDADSGLAALTYSRPADDTFTVNVKTAEGAEFAMELKAL